MAAPQAVPATRRLSALVALVSLCFVMIGSASAQPRAAVAGPVFVDGQAQVVPAFADPLEWIREELWVEAPFDSDQDGMPDRLPSVRP